jgi:hypothetical protein
MICAPFRRNAIRVPSRLTSGVESAKLPPVVSRFAVLPPVTGSQ